MAGVYLNGKEFLKPSQDFKKAFVYVCDGKKVGKKLYVYFNARDGWFWGKERIGLVVEKQKVVMLNKGLVRG
ncbi:MAG: hypothetical protein UU16_C0037G0015 [Candidatus Woesebacteria bacterium GW2011_GWA2_40_7]|uniref:Uncharacterized protein n=1 Tax=Candidatus Woesebacteria bacterium GW2011_GWA2_40_7 TaxID=1618562 RepID=A0A0G0VLH9_9BACT|nr:MAG: hypothetical protein UU16_C0037G0015 [Candidatus Woesebacteria bacterium GW2011_GWA2_40_7]